MAVDAGSSTLHRGDAFVVAIWVLVQVLPVVSSFVPSVAFVLCT